MINFDFKQKSTCTLQTDIFSLIIVNKFKLVRYMYCIFKMMNLQPYNTSYLTRMP